MLQSTITIDVILDKDKIPEQINWQASDSTADIAQKAKAIMLAFWDSTDKSALRIDLWTKDMMVDEMGDFFYQTFMSMADTYDRSTRDIELVNEIKHFAKVFYLKFKEQQLKDHKA